VGARKQSKPIAQFSRWQVPIGVCLSSGNSICFDIEVLVATPRKGRYAFYLLCTSQVAVV
jgi:hypothetical protein